MSDAIYPTGPNGIWVFLIVTVGLAGAASQATGRAVAHKWAPYWQLVVYVALLTFAARFLHATLFAQPFLDPRNVIVDFVVLLLIATVGFRVARTRQMARQYPWLYEARSPFYWAQRNTAEQHGT